MDEIAYAAFENAIPRLLESRGNVRALIILFLVL